jgi:hypothetical protein
MTQQASLRSPPMAVLVEPDTVHGAMLDELSRSLVARGFDVHRDRANAAAKTEIRQTIEIVVTTSRGRLDAKTMAAFSRLHTIVAPTTDTEAIAVDAAIELGIAVANGFGGFYTEIARTFVFGKASAELNDGFELAKEAQAHTLNYLRPGALCKDVFAKYDAFMQRRGFPSEKRLYAHGQGYDMLERPLVRQDEPMVFEENMNIVVHPGIATASMFAVVCDNFLVTKGPPVRLHGTEQKIFEL